MHERGLIWKGSKRMILDNSLGGVGIGNWKIYFPKYGSDIWRARQGMVQFQRPHNDFIWVLSELGILGLLTYVSIFISAFYCGLKILLQMPVKPQERNLIIWVLVSLLAYIVVSLFSFPRERIYHQWLLFGSLAMVFGIYLRYHSIKVVPKKKGNQTFVLGLIISGIFLLISFERYRGEKLSRELSVTRETSNWSRMKKLSSTANQWVFYTMDPTSIPLKFYEGLACLNLQDLECAELGFKEAYRLHPNNIHIINNLANVYQFSNKSSEAIKYYEQALEISAKYQDGALNLAAAYFNTNRVIEAYDVLLRYKLIFPEDDESYKSYVLVIVKTIRDNLLDEINNPLIKQTLAGMNDEWLFQIHSKIALDKMAVENRLIEDAIYALEKVTHEILPEQAEEYRKYYLPK